MELTIILVTVALLAGYALSSIIGFRNARLQGMEDKLRRSLLADAEAARESLRAEFRDEREELKSQIRELQIEVKSLQKDLVAIQRDTLDQIAALHGALQEAKQENARIENALFDAMRLNTEMAQEVAALKKENNRLGELLTELREQVARLLEAAHGEDG